MVFRAQDDPIQLDRLLTDEAGGFALGPGGAELD